MTTETFIGAAVCIVAGLVALTLCCLLIRHERDAWRDRRDAAHFRRFCAACGGRESALRVIDAAEATADSGPAITIGRELRQIHRGNIVRLVPRVTNRQTGGPVHFDPGGDAA